MGDSATAPVLDSDVLIDHLRNAGPGRAPVDEPAATSGFRIAAITLFELAPGAGLGRAPRAADALMSVPCLTLTRGAARRSGAPLRELRSGGAPMDIRDAMQAGICLEAGAPPVTRNVSHLARVTGLRVVEPGRWWPAAT